MTFAEKLKNARRQAALSQELLAEKLGVSRQAVTKWESGSGIPDIENIIALAQLFDISVDDLLSNGAGAKKAEDFLFESITEYDICEQKNYDMKFGRAKKFVLSGCTGEKIRVRLASNTLSSIQNDFNIKIDDTKRRLDVNLNKKNETDEASAKEGLYIFVQIPSLYIKRVECEINAETAEVHTLACDSLELDAKISNLILDGVKGTLEINCNLDMNILCNDINGSIEINQISAISKISVPENTGFTAIKKGVGTKIFYNKNGKPTKAFYLPDSDNIIELNGIKSELIICAHSSEVKY